MSYSGVCGTDLHILKGEFPVSKSAVVLGHEFCGIADAVGAEVKHVQVGDRYANYECSLTAYCSMSEKFPLREFQI